MNNQTLLELHVEDFEPIKQYYQALGFEIAWEREPEEKKGYLVMHMQDNILCFWAGNQNVKMYMSNPTSSDFRKIRLEVTV